MDVAFLVDRTESLGQSDFYALKGLVLQIVDALRAAIRNFHLGPCKIEKSKIAKLCHNKGLPKPFIKI